MKSASEIHAQGKRLMSRCFNRKQPDGQRWLMTVVRIHNEYMANISSYFGVANPNRLLQDDRTVKLPQEIYRNTYSSGYRSELFNEDIF